MIFGMRWYVCRSNRKNHARFYKGSSSTACGIIHLAHSGRMFHDCSKASTATSGVTSPIVSIVRIRRGVFRTPNNLAHFSFPSTRQAPKVRASVSLCSSNYAMVVPGAGIHAIPDLIWATFPTGLLGFGLSFPLIPAAEGRNLKSRLQCAVFGGPRCFPFFGRLFVCAWLLSKEVSRSGPDRRLSILDSFVDSFLLHHGKQ